MKRYAFSLLELSIVLIILAILAVPSMKMLNESQNSAKYHATRQTLNIIQKAMFRYHKASATGILPCPAIITQSTATQTSDEANCSTTTTVSDGSGDNILFGAVPAKDLGINKEYILDAWGRKFSYYVTKKSTAAGSTTALTNGIKIHDSNINADSDYVYVVISHGEDGIGAYQENGSQTDTSSNTDKSTIETKNYYAASKTIDSSNRLYISKGAVRDISIGATNFDIISDNGT